MGGFAPDEKGALAMPAFLHIDPWRSEPDTRHGQKPVALKGTLTVTDLVVGSKYAIYRWDTVAEAFTDYSDQYKRISFVATSSTFVYVDEKTFQSNGTTYYRAVKEEHIEELLASVDINYLLKVLLHGAHFPFQIVQFNH